MTAAHDYEEMRHLLDRLPPGQVRHLRLIASSDPQIAPYLDEEGAAPPRRFASIGVIEDGPDDLAERAEEFVHEHFGESR